MDPGFLDRGFIFTRGGGGGFNLVIVPDHLIFCPDFSGNSS